LENISSILFDLSEFSMLHSETFDTINRFEKMEVVANRNIFDGIFEDFTAMNIQVIIRDILCVTFRRIMLSPPSPWRWRMMVLLNAGILLHHLTTSQTPRLEW